MLSCNNKTNKKVEQPISVTHAKNLDCSEYFKDTIEKESLTLDIKNRFISSGLGYFFHSSDSIKVTKFHYIKDPLKIFKTVIRVDFYSQKSQDIINQFNKEGITNLKQKVWNKLIPKKYSNKISTIIIYDKALISKNDCFWD